MKTLLIKTLTTITFLLLIVIGNLSAQTTYWVDNNGVASWAQAQSNSPLSGPAACSMDTANANAQSGDIILVRGGTYNTSIAPNNSGTANAKIIYRGYNDEMPFIQAGNPVKVNNRSYIVIDGFNLSTPILTYNAAVIILGTYNELHNSIIDNPAVVPGMPESTNVSPHSGAGLVLHKAKFITIDNVTISGWWVGLNAAKSAENLTIRNSMIVGNIATAIALGPRLGNEAQNDPNPLKHLIENNIIGGSLVSDGIQTESMNSDVVNIRGIIIRDNTFYFFGENALDFKSGGDILVENNTFVASLGDNDGMGVRSTSTGNTVERSTAAILIGSSRRSEQVIIRNNVFYDNISGIQSGGRYWKMYNNTMVANNRDAYGWNSSYTGGAIPKTFRGYGVNWSHSLYMNNIVVDQKHASVSIGNTPFGIPFRINNNLYGEISGSPKFIKGRNASDLEDFTFSEWKTYLTNFNNAIGKEQASLVGNPQFVNVPRSASTFPYFNYTEASVGNPVYPIELTFADLDTWFPYDFSLQSNSDAIDTGGFLTTATNSGNNSLTLQVVDSRVFADGYGITGEGDVIQIGSEPTVKISGINYANNTITLEASRSWSTGANVSLPYSGSSPDIGAYEYNDDTPPPSPLPSQATSPYPENGEQDVSITTDLSWTSGSGATSHDVYFGTTSNALTFIGNQVLTSYNPTANLTLNTTYYWRVDEVNTAGVTTGTEWSFTAQATLPSTNIYEAELLPVSASSGDAIYIVEDSTVSNGEWLLYKSDAVGDYVSFDVEVAQAGIWMISIDFWSHTARGAIQLSIDGTDVGAPIDEYRTTQSLVTATQIGQYTFPSAGTYSFTFTNVKRNANSTAHKFSLDLIRLEEVVTPPISIYEAELLPVSASSGDAIYIVEDSTVSNGEWLLYKSDAVGDYVSFDVNIVQTGTYDIFMDFWSHVNRGTIQMSINDTDVGNPLDQHRNEQGLVTDVALGTYTFDSTGIYTFKFTNLERNASSGSHKFAIDLLNLMITNISTISVEEKSFGSRIQVYPNPTSNTFIIDLKNETLKEAIIYNQLGQQVKEATTNEVNISNLSNGIYFVKITSQSGKTATKKIIKN